MRVPTPIPFKDLPAQNRMAAFLILWNAAKILWNAAKLNRPEVKDKY
jgi:hypothetical protein